MFTICQVSIAPIRATASDKSEMVSQVLFGECAEVLEKQGNWWQIRCVWDDYQGWVDAKQFLEITFEQYISYSKNYAVSLSLAEGLMAADYFLPLTMGASLPEFDGLRCKIGQNAFQFSGPVVTPKIIEPTGDWIVKMARRYLHAPYLWGGRSPFGIDCSGFTQVVFKIGGIKLLRDASQQVIQGRTVDFLTQCQAGDLAFFDNGKGGIGHVGIIMPDCHVIHASGKVRVDKIDHFGIFNKEESRYSHQLRVVKRLLPDAQIQDLKVDLDSKIVENGVFENQFALFE